MPITINGSGTLTGINAGGYPDATVTVDDLASDVLKVKAVSTKIQSFATNIITTSGTYTDTGIFINHTPTSTSAKLVINFSSRLASAYGSNITHLYRLRNASGVNVTNSEWVFSLDTPNGSMMLNFTDIWEPNTTDEQTIKLFAAQSNGTSSQLISPVTMSVIEV